jgi:hypothetical protein
MIHKPKTLIEWLVYGFIALIILGVVVVCPVIAYTTDEYITATVTKTERVTQSNGDGGVSSKYLVYTDVETFENTDTLWYFKFDSSDLYGSIKEKATYRMRVNGFRIGFLSSYRNILSMEEVTKQDE